MRPQKLSGRVTGQGVPASESVPDAGSQGLGEQESQPFRSLWSGGGEGQVNR